MKSKRNNLEDINQFIAGVIRNPESRVEVVKRNHMLFFCTYFSDHLEYEIADFQKEMFRVTEDEKLQLAVVTAFRSSGKSTVMNMSYALWSILGVQQKKFIVIVSKTQEQARSHFANIKNELETNELLRQDLGPFQEDFTWNTGALVIPKYNAKIIAVSQDQKIRGLKFGKYRPQLIIADDIEDSNSVKSSEIRDKVYKWFTDEVMTLGTNKTKVVVIGNLLHDDSLISRLEMQIHAGERSGIYRQFPIMDEFGAPLWPGRFPTAESVEEEKKRIGDRFTWLREYMLVVVDDRKPVIEKKWLHYYKDLPEPLRNQGHAYACGVDPAFSENTKADNTAVVSAFIIGSGDDRKIYILPNPINEKLQMPDSISRIKMLTKTFKEKVNHKVYVEEVGAQLGLVQQLEREGVSAEGIRFGGNDKRSRLAQISNLIKEGKILFCDYGDDELIYQMVNFGSTRYDDLVDALTTLIIGIWEKPPSTHHFTNEDVKQMSRALRRMMYGPDDDFGGGTGMGPGVSWSVELGQDGQFHRRY